MRVGVGRPVRVGHGPQPGEFAAHLGAIFGSVLAVAIELIGYRILDTVSPLRQLLAGTDLFVREVEGVDLVVDVAHFFNEVEVLSLEELHEQSCNFYIALAHFLERATQALGDDFLGKTVARQLCNVVCDVTHALQRRAHSQGAYNNAQIARDRLLAGENLNREFVERDGKFIDVDVVFDHLFGEAQITVGERLRCTRDRNFDELG